MMVEAQLKQKLAALEEWLRCNNTHPDYALILQDKQRIEKQVKTRQDESKLNKRNGAV
ncbi:hypothetical protein [Myroides odoratus]|uniref:hypothetical protein n=1 Tax=Myroides odoratus TaxID=256 RepID=UPI00334025F9